MLLRENKVLRLRAWLIIGAVCAFAGMVELSASADTASPWVSSAAPTLQKSTDLPDNVPPSQSNRDCDSIRVRFINPFATTDDCVVQTPWGLGGDKGMIFTGGPQMVDVEPPGPFAGLHYIPNQSLVYTYTSASVIGSYMGFYRNYRINMPYLPNDVHGFYQFVLNKGPDFVLKNIAGSSQPVNPETLAFSENGDWMVLDFPFQGFVRVNLATFDMVPFAPSMNQGGDYANYGAQLSISNDGRYVVVKPGSSSTFKVYDLTSCSNAVLPVDPANPKCQSRDYWPDLNRQLPGLRAIYQPRFTSSMQLSLTAQYNYSSSGSYKVAKYNLTAPGENPLGIEYLGMGDSYASGQGAFNYITGTDTSNNPCHLSSLSYSFLVGSLLFNSSHSIACSGAKTADVTNTSQFYKGQVKDGISRRDRQNIDQILATYSPGYISQTEFVQKYNPQIVTLSIAGNDIGFEDIVTRCVSPAIFNTTCYSSKEDQQELLDRINNMQNKLQNTYRAVSASGRRVYIIGYPHIVAASGSCALNVHLDDRERQLFIDLTNALNRVIQQAAAGAGVQYVDVSDALAGHRMCETKSSDVAINGLTAGNDKDLGPLFGPMNYIGAESYHPNALGHELLKQAILKQTNSFKTYVKAAAPQTAPVLPAANAPSTGRAINLTATANELVPAAITPLTALSTHIDSQTTQLKASSTFQAKLDDKAAAIGSGTTDASGTFTGNVTLPADTTCGHHTLHMYGLNIVGQPVDVYKEVYVAPQTGTCGDAKNSCGVVPNSGQDVDKDGIDDACDPLIADPPKPAGYTVYLTANSIHATTAQPVSQSTVQPSANVPLNASPVDFVQPTPATTDHRATINYVLLSALLVTTLIGGRLYLRKNRYHQG